MNKRGQTSLGRQRRPRVTVSSRPHRVLARVAGLGRVIVRANRVARCFVALSGALILTGGLVGCSDNTPDAVVVRVGSIAIYRSTVEHWEHAIARGGLVGSSPGGSTSSPRVQALDFLISSDWLIGEADEHGLTISNQAITRSLGEGALSSEGNAELKRELSSTGQTLSDLRFEIKTELAAAALRSFLSRSAPKVAQSRVADFYRHHLVLFRSDRRVVDLIEGIESRAAARALGRRIGSGARFAQLAVRETVSRQSLYESDHRENRDLVRAIFATPPGIVGGPASYNSQWVLLVVRAVRRGTIAPFAKVRAEIGVHLLALHRRSIAARFVKALREKWRAKTTCESSFVVSRCSQYRGRSEPEANPLAG